MTTISYHIELIHDTSMSLVRFEAKKWIAAHENKVVLDIT